MKPIAVLIALLFYIKPVQAVDETGFVPLTDVVTKETSSPHAVEALILKGGDVNARDEQGRSVLMLAAMHHPDPLVSHILIQGGAQVNARTPDTGRTALFYAIQYNENPKVFLTLINNGADQDIKDVFGRTAYDYADRNPKLKNNPVLRLFHTYQEKEDVEEASSDSDISR